MDETTDYEILWNYQNICRTCLSETNELVSIFINSKTQNKTYAEMIMACTSLQILETDEVSLKICPSCINQIEQSYLFCKKCQEADLILQFSHKFYRKSQNESNNIKNNIKHANTVDRLSNQTNQTINEHIKCDEYEEVEDASNGLTTSEFDCTSQPKYVLISINDQTIKLTNKVVKCEDFKKGIVDESNESDNGLLESKFDSVSLSSNISTRKQNGRDADNKVTLGLNKNGGNKVFQCNYCLKSYISELSLEKHVETHSKQAHECFECGLKYSCSQSLEQHKRFHVDGKGYVCNICNLKFPDVQHLAYHKIIHLNKPKFVCDECGQVLSSNSSFKHHKSAHDGSIKRKCTICGIDIRKNNLARHMYQHTSKPYICDMCGRGFVQKTALERHIMICGKYPQIGQTNGFHMCSICSKTFKNEHGLRLHFQYKHTTGHKGSNTKYNCTKCKRTFPLKHYFERHICSNGYTLPTVCKICNEKFETYTKFVKHRKSQHKAVPTKLYQCEICGNSLSSEICLVKHMLVHNGIKPHKCSFCEKTFRQSSHKNSHELLHTGGKPYTCAHCNKSFRHRTTLVEHTRQHTGETPYKCRICNKGFYRTGNLKKHLLIH